MKNIRTMINGFCQKCFDRKWNLIQSRYSGLLTMIYREGGKENGLIN